MDSFDSAEEEEEEVAAETNKEEEESVSLKSNLKRPLSVARYEHHSNGCMKAAYSLTLSALMTSQTTYIDLTTAVPPRRRV